MVGREKYFFIINFTKETYNDEADHCSTGPCLHFRNEFWNLPCVVIDIINHMPQVIDAEDEVGIGIESTSFSINRLSYSPKELGADQLTRFW
jgi:hypothetical protein